MLKLTFGRLFAAAAVVSLATMLACSSDEEGTSESDQTACNAPVAGVSLKPAFANLKFTIPTSIVLSPDKKTYFVAEKAGIIKTFANNANVDRATVALDIKSRVNSGDREPGINGIALHPNWPAVPEAYITYNGFVNGNGYTWTLSRFISKDGGRTLSADPKDETVLIQGNKPASQHNGGQVLFHPTEKGSTGVPLLYVSVGDSEFEKGPLGNAQNPNAIFGKFLRLDVLDGATRASKKVEYDAPEDNMFGAKGEFPPVDGTPRGRKEIFSLGHRNPWRFSFDQHDGKVDIWEGEVGQDAFEEIQIVRKGRNYGWNFKESLHKGFCKELNNCVTKPIGVCRANEGDVCASDVSGIADPLVEIPHRADPNDPLTRNAGGYTAQSVTGGFVYRGSNTKLASLKGLYIYSDFQNGALYSLVPSDKLPADIRSQSAFTPLKIGSGAMITSFTLDENNEILALDFRGSIYRVDVGSCARLPDPNARTYVYLSKQGILSFQEGIEYLVSANADIPALKNFRIDAAKMPKEPGQFGAFEEPNYTLSEWKQQFMGGDKVSALYKNDLDLGFWRQLECTKNIGPGVGGCAVTNWPATNDKNLDPTKGGEVVPDPNGLTDDKDNLGTVCMNISPEGFTRFYIFGVKAPHKVQPFAVLDGEGEKVSPALCTPCHAGTYAGVPDMGSIFRELEPSALRRHPSVSQEQAEQQWFALNEAMKSANRSLRGNALSPLANGVTPQRAVLDYIQAMYPGGGPPAITAHDPRHVPKSFTDNAPGVTDAYRQAKVDLYTKLIGPYCASCHRLNNTDLDKYDFVQGLSSPSGDDVQLHQLIFPLRNDPKRLTLPQMPQSQFQQFKVLQDRAAIDSINAWVAQLADPKLPQCEVTFTIRTDVNAPGFDPSNEALRVLGQTVPPQGVVDLGRPDPLSNWKATDPGLDLARTADDPGGRFRFTGHASFPQGSRIEFKGVVGKNESVRFERNNQGNRTLVVPNTTTTTVEFDWEN